MSFLKKIVIFVITLEARLVLWKYKPMIVAITGNVGKTSTKDAVHTVLASMFFVRRSYKSYNSELGIPLTILGCESGWRNPFAWLKVCAEGFALVFLKNHYPKVIVLEVGADKPGDISRICKWISPDIVVVTKFGDVPVHVEFFDSRDALIAEKRCLVRALKKQGTLVLNSDDKETYAFKDDPHGKLFTYGTNDKALVRGSNLEVRYRGRSVPNGVACKISYKEQFFPLFIKGTIGVHLIYPALAAFAVGEALEVPTLKTLESLNGYLVPPGRMRTLRGIKDSCIIDDSYNSSPTATESALRSLKEVHVQGKKIAVFGDMLELGKHSAEAHRKIGAFSAHCVDLLVTVGFRAKLMEDAALEQGMSTQCVKHFKNSEEATLHIQEYISEGDIVLVKGSESMRMERVVARLLKEPDQDKKLLVRQNKEWVEKT
jgi:UDP-N-acetylmuramoyl-tripeptide--D-alanyl-D-alanine ligase